MKNSYLEYKGYHSKPEYSAEDKCFIGRLFLLNDIVAYDGETYEEAERSFHDCVDAYLADCASVNAAPEKECTGNFNIRITPEEHQLAVQQARRRNQSLNGYIKDAIKNWNEQSLGQPVFTYPEIHPDSNVVAEEVPARQYGVSDAEILRLAANIIAKVQGKK